MSDSPQSSPEQERDPSPPASGASVAPASPPPEEPTVGTGSAVALGCVGATVLLMVIGILLVMWLR